MGRKGNINKAIERRGKLGELFTRKVSYEQPSMRKLPVVKDAVSRFTTVTAPVASGNIYRAQRPVVRNTKKGVVVTGSDLVSVVVNTTSPLWQIGSIVPIHPAYFIGTGLANYCRTYAHYRFRSLRFGFHTRMPTSTAGEIMMSVRKNAIEPSENPADLSFLSKVMSRANAAIGPVWANLHADVDCDLNIRNVDAFMTDWNDNVAGELEIYVQTSSTTAEVGYVSMAYEIEFLDVIVAPHTSEIPLAAGARVAPQNIITIPAAATRVVGGSLGATSSLLTSQVDGTIWKVTLDADLSVFGGVNNNQIYGVLNPAVTSATSATINFTNVENLGVIDGSVIYALDIGGSNVSLYLTYDAAVAGGFGGLLVHTQTLAMTTVTLFGSAHVVRLGYDSLLAA